MRWNPEINYSKTWDKVSAWIQTHLPPYLQIELQELMRHNVDEAVNNIESQLQVKIRKLEAIIKRLKKPK